MKREGEHQMFYDKTSLFSSAKKIVILAVMIGLLLIPSLSQAVSPSTPVNDNTEFVKMVYRDFLNREADQGGLDYWVNGIDAGTLTKAECVEAFLQSAEFGGNVSPVTRLYFAYFLRIPDYIGLMYWIGQYEAGASLNSISETFAQSAEFIATYGSLTNSEFVSLVYNNVLERTPDQAGLDYWTGLLDGGMSRGAAMTGFSESAEYLASSASEIYVTMTYIGLLRRSPDQSGYDYWVGVLDGGNSGLGLIDGFLAAQEYGNRFLLYGNIVGSWGVGYDSGSDTLMEMTFYDNNTYVFYQKDVADYAGNEGLEYGTYHYDQAAGTLVAYPVVDDNNQWGLSHPYGQGALDIMIIGQNTITIGDTLGTDEFTRVIDSANPILGSWHLTNDTYFSLGEFTMTFYGNGTYFFWQKPDVECSGGIEYGNYTYNGQTETLITTPVFNDADGAGSCGLATAPAGDSVQVIGDALTWGTDIFTRVEALPSPAINNSIVGLWGKDPVTGEEPTANDPWVMAFHDNGFYIHYQLEDGSGDCVTGVEYGTYTYDPVAGTLNAYVTGDTNGTCGFSDAGGTAIPALVWGEMLVLGSPGDQHFVSRVVSSGSDSLAGSWEFPGSAPTTADPYTLTFYNNGFYIHWQIADGSGDCLTGVEYGTYVFDSAGETLTMYESYDNNGTCGFLDITGSGIPFPAVLSGDTLVVDAPDGQFSIQKMRDIPEQLTAEWLNGNTFYAVWFGDGLDPGGQTIQNVPVVLEYVFNQDGSIDYMGLYNAGEGPNTLSGSTTYSVDADGILHFASDDDPAQGNQIACGSTNQYVKTHYLNGDGSFNNVDLFFFDQAAALDFASTLTGSIPPCIS